MNLCKTTYIKDNNLFIGGIKADELAQKYGTPLYVMDVARIRTIVRAYSDTLTNKYGNAHMSFASKAFSCKAIYSVMKSEGAHVDVVSLGEMFTVNSAGFDMSKVYFHGNNKSIKELEYAVDNGVGTVVIDNLEEITLLNTICAERGVCQVVEIRTNPGVEAHTHSYIQTAKVDSKFGFSIASGDANVAIAKIISCKNLHFKGVTCHIGSQIFDTGAFRLAADVMTDYLVAIKAKFNIEVEELNMGGGFAIHYTQSDPKYSVEDYCNYVNIIIEELNNCFDLKKINKPILNIEPGRSIVGESGITLYSVGNIKDIANIKKYICIDGGMFDNIRPSLYGAEYEAIIANRANEAKTELVTIAGKCCESADIIIKDIMLPKARRGDIIAVFSTGAYNYSMANNYNRNAVPPVVFVENGNSDYAVKPQSCEDIIRNDAIPEWLK